MSDESGPSLRGELVALAAALGTPEGSARFLDVVVLAGPRMARHEYENENGPGVFVVFEGGGVDAQFVGGVLRGLLIHLVSDERPTYARLDALIEGLSLPATRDEVHARLGEPDQVYQRPDLEQYRFDDVNVQFDFVSDRTTAITLAWVGDPASV